MSAVCSVDGCGRDSRANGMCETHYRQHKRTGTTSPIRPRRKHAYDLLTGPWRDVIGPIHPDDGDSDDERRQR